MLSVQEAFDQGARHLLRQNEKAFEDGKSRYRTREGLKCGVGCFIPDAEYRPEFEGVGIGLSGPGHVEHDRAEDVRALRRVLKKVAPHWSLLTSLQSIHDFRDVCDWPSRLKVTGKSFKLKLNAVNEFSR